MFQKYHLFQKTTLNVPKKPPVPKNVQVLGLNVGEAQLESPECLGDWSLLSVSGGSKRELKDGPFGVCLGDQDIELQARLAAVLVYVDVDEIIATLCGRFGNCGKALLDGSDWTRLFDEADVK